jgi:hypothetical protein
LFGSALATLILSGRSRLVTASAAATIGISLFCIVAIRQRHKWTPRVSAAAIERVQPQSRNLIVTAEELLRHPERARPWVRVRVVEAAAAIIRTGRNASAVPLGRDIALASVAATCLVLVGVNLPQRAVSAVRQAVERVTGGERPPAAAIAGLTATIVPPAYLGLPARTVENPDRIDAIAGSRLELVSRTTGSHRVRFGATPLASTATGQGLLRTELTLTESGYLAIDAQSSADVSARRLIAVAVTPDRAPVIRIDRPGKDLLVSDTRLAVPVRTSATDDFGLEALELRYTRVTGSGEQFEFEEGSIPLDVQRQSNREWKAQAALALAGLDLHAGDSLVYRVVGRDARPGDAGLASSDTFFVEVAGPGQAALAGFELPPDRERYALSQQMIVLKIQRLRAREQARGGVPRPALTGEASAIAAEQRAVRANFIFLTGGHVEDEVEEAEQSHEIQEGRLENTARREIGLAIQHMSRADQALMAIDTASALVAARAAVEALQRAFGRNRYILRTLPVRSRIDPSRRLSGNLDEAGDARREHHETTPHPASRVRRRLLARLIDLKPALTSAGAARQANELTSLAEEALSVAAKSEAWQRIARQVLTLRDVAAAGKLEDTADKIHELVGALLEEAGKEAIPTVPVDDAERTLRSAWAGERHRR